MALPCPLIEGGAEVAAVLCLGLRGGPEEGGLARGRVGILLIKKMKRLMRGSANAVNDHVYHSTGELVRKPMVS